MIKVKRREHERIKTCNPVKFVKPNYSHCLPISLLEIWISSMHSPSRDKISEVLNDLKFYDINGLCPFYSSSIATWLQKLDYDLLTGHRDSKMRNACPLHRTVTFSIKFSSLILTTKLTSYPVRKLKATRT